MKKKRTAFVFREPDSSIGGIAEDILQSLRLIRLLLPVLVHCRILVLRLKLVVVCHDNVFTV